MGNTTNAESNSSPKNEKKGIRHKVKHFYLNYTKIAIAITLVIIIALIYFGTNLYLVMNFMLGNDILIKVNTNKQNFEVFHGTNENLEIEVSVTSNPFCKTICDTKFIDISSGKTINSENITITPNQNSKQNFQLNSEQYGAGIKLYKYKISCTSPKSAFCYSDTTPTTNDLLFTLQYKLTPEEEKIKGQNLILLNETTKKLNLLKDLAQNLANIENNIKLKIASPVESNSITELQTKINNTNHKLIEISNAWNQENYASIGEDINNLNATLNEINSKYEEIHSNLSTTIEKYNLLLENYNNLNKNIEKLETIPELDSTDNSAINNIIFLYNIYAKSFNNDNSLFIKESNYDHINSDYQNTKIEIENKQINASITNSINTAILQDTYCRSTENCKESTKDNKQTFIQKIIYTETQSKNIENNTTNSANNTNTTNTTLTFTLEESCNNINAINQEISSKYNKINTSSISNAEINNATIEIEKIKSNIAEEYLQILNKLNLSNQSSIKNILEQFTINTNSNENGTNANNTNDISEDTIIIALNKELPAECSNTKYEFTPIYNLTSSKIIQPEITFTSSNITFNRNIEKCCINGICTECCNNKNNNNSTDNNLNNNFNCENKASPILIIHGHSFNKALSAEYSPVAFNKIQDKLENIGYLSAGFLSIESDKNMTQGILGKIPESVSFKTSYYFDVFHDKESSRIIQTKSENIDTYAIRLKEIIDIEKYRTGKDKVTIIAHSMGGLVVRRYMDIFGEDSIDKLIMIGTPNNGIEDDIAKYCRLFGENTECNDMSKNSLLMSKLRQRTSSTVKIYSIIGTGCDMNGEDGDGIVTKTNAELSYAKNIYIKGTCTSTAFLHTGLLDTEKYPEAYKAIEDALEN